MDTGFKEVQVCSPQYLKGRSLLLLLPPLGTYVVLLR